MVYYKIPLSGGLHYPTGCILCCAYTYDGYEYCKFERVTEVGSNWVPITEAEFDVLCPEFPTPSAPASTKRITEIGEKNGMKYTVYSDGTAECWGTVTTTIVPAIESILGFRINIYPKLPLTFSKFDSVHVNILCERSDGSYESPDPDVNLSVWIGSIDASAERSKLYVNMQSDLSAAESLMIDKVRLFITVRGVVS